MTKLRLTHDNHTTTVTSERKARAWAREQLGASRVKETRPRSNRYFGRTTP